MTVSGRFRLIAGEVVQEVYLSFGGTNLGGQSSLSKKDTGVIVVFGSSSRLSGTEGKNL